MSYTSLKSIIYHVFFASCSDIKFLGALEVLLFILVVCVLVFVVKDFLWCSKSFKLTIYLWLKYFVLIKLNNDHSNTFPFLCQGWVGVITEVFRCGLVDSPTVLRSTFRHYIFKILLRNVIQCDISTKYFTFICDKWLET